MTEIFGASGHPIGVLLTNHGRKLHPDRVIPAAMKRRLEQPNISR